MVVLRATQKVLKLLPEPSGSAVTSTTALGDWYINRIVVDRHPLLLLVSSRSLLSVITPARDVKDCHNAWLPSLKSAFDALGPMNATSPRR